MESNKRYDTEGSKRHSVKRQTKDQLNNIKQNNTKSKEVYVEKGKEAKKIFKENNRLFLEIKTDTSGRRFCK